MYIVNGKTESSEGDTMGFLMYVADFMVPAVLFLIVTYGIMEAYLMKENLKSIKSSVLYIDGIMNYLIVRISSLKI